MLDILQQIVQGYLAKSFWELIAVLLSVAYLALAMRENIWCWPAAFFSTLIFALIFWDVSLLMDSGLSVYYMVMAVYGWYVWTHGDKTLQDTEATLDKAIERWPWRKHVIAIASVLFISAISGFLLERFTQAAWPYLDSFTTWASVFTTYLVAKKILENWLYWIVIDSVALGLYIERELYTTAALFAVYLVMCIFGYRAWKKSMLTSDNTFVHAGDRQVVTE